MTVHHLVVAFEDADQRGIETTGGVIIGRGGKFIIETKRIQKRPQPRIVVRAKTGVGAERIRNAGQRLAEKRRQHVPVRHVVRHLAQPIHVIAESDQARRPAGEHGKRMAHPRGARHLAESADMRQAGGTIAGLEQRRGLARPVQPGSDLGSFLERPRLWQRRLVVANCCRHRRQARYHAPPGQSLEQSKAGASPQTPRGALPLDPAKGEPLEPFRWLG